MSKSTASPAPWHCDPHPGAATNLVYDADGIVIAVVCGNDRGRSGRNLRLATAAPELLAALKGVIAVADRKTDEFDRARAAIAKAEGA